MKFTVLSLLALVFSASGFAADDRVVSAFSVMQQVNQLEILASGLELSKGLDAESKAYAKGALDRHTQMEKELDAFALAKGIKLEKQLAFDDLTAQTVAVEALKVLSGDALDKGFVKAMVQIHAISLQNLYQSQYDFRTTEEGKYLANLIDQVHTGYVNAVKIADRFKI